MTKDLLTTSWTYGRAEVKKPGLHRHAKSLTGLISIRWMLLLLFVGGYFETRQVFRFYAAEYFALSLVSAIVCFVLMTRLNAPAKHTLALWIILLVFCIGYYLQFFMLVLDPDVYSALVLPPGDASESVFIHAYSTTTVAFLAFCFTAWVLLVLKRRRPKEQSRHGQTIQLALLPARKACTLFLWGTILLESITAYAFWKSGIAVMGAQAVALPYRLAGVIFYTRLIVLPGLLLLVIWLADLCNFRGIFRAAVSLLILHSATDAVLRSSRGTVVFALLELVFLFALSRQLTRRRMAWITAGVVICLFLFPALSAYRNLRLTHPSQIVTPLREGFLSAYSSGSVQDTVFNAGYAFLFRVSGMGSLVPIVASDATPLGVGRANVVTTFFNRGILGIPETSVNSVAPSLVGWFYLVDRGAGVLLGISALVALAQIVWEALDSSVIYSTPLAQSLFLTFLISVVTDGVLESSLWAALGVAVSIAVAELLLRTFRVNRVIVAQPARSVLTRREGEIRWRPV